MNEYVDVDDGQSYSHVQELKYTNTHTNSHSHSHTTNTISYNGNELFEDESLNEIVSELSEPPTYQVYRIRWWALFVFSLSSFTNGMLWVTFASIEELATGNICTHIY
jgi:hypothetical protein